MGVPTRVLNDSLATVFRLTSPGYISVYNMIYSAQGSCNLYQTI